MHADTGDEPSAIGAAASARAQAAALALLMPLLERGATFPNAAALAAATGATIWRVGYWRQRYPEVARILDTLLP